MAELRADVVIVGGGVLGLAVARELAGQRTRRVVVLEADRVGSARGSSHGDARMRVLAAFPDASYLERGRRAGEGWAALERELGEPLRTRTGCLSMGGELPRLAQDLERHGERCEVLDASDLRRRFPSLRLAEDARALHQPDSEVIHADRAVQALAQSAAGRGVELREGTRAVAVDPVNGEVRFGTDRMRSQTIVICAGPWAAQVLATAGLPVPPLRTTLQTVSYFEWPDPPPIGVIEYDAPDPYACWSPGGGLKAADHAPGPVVAPEAPRAPVAAAADRTRHWVAERFGLEVARRRRRVETCLYTSTPDERFVQERHARVVVGSACSGHGFQYVPDTARRLARLALDPTHHEGAADD